MLSVHGVVNHESCGPAPHNTAGIDENGCGYRADDAVVCVSALLESVSGLLESVSGAGAAFRAVNAPCLRKKKKNKLRQDKMNLETQREKRKDQALSV